MSIGKVAQNWARRRPVNWTFRHIAVLFAAALGTYAFLESRAEWSEMHRWNRAVGDTSVVLIAMAMAVGPLARLLRPVRTVLVWRREFGIHGVVLAIAHTIIILAGWVQWDLVRLFGYEIHPVSGNYVMLQHGFGLANVIGIVALIYAIVLAASSNDWSQRWLGATVWKFLQQSSYVLWTLIVIHTAYFLFLHFQDFHRSVPDPNWAQTPFLGLIALVTLLQFASFTKIWAGRRNKGSHSNYRGGSSVSS